MKSTRICRVILFMILCLLFTVPAFADVLTIPVGVKEIGEEAFYGDTSLDQVVLPEGIEKIGPRAFGESSLSSINLPASLENIGDDALDPDADIQVTAVKGSKAYDWAVEKGFIKEQEESSSVTFKFEENGDGTCTVTGIQSLTFDSFSKDLVIPSYGPKGKPVTAIGERAFAGMRDFKAGLVIPNSVTTIGDYAFAWCDGFTGNLTIPQSVTTIGVSAFSMCSGFTGNLTIPEIVTVIGEDAFRECTGFTGNLIIPDSVIRIGYVAFGGCSGLNGTLTIGKNVTYIGASAFEMCTKLTGHVVIPSSVKEMGRGAFYGCSGLEEITVSDGITYFDFNTITDCSGLKRLNLPESITSIKNFDYDDWEVAELSKDFSVYSGSECARKWAYENYVSFNGGAVDYTPQMKRFFAQATNIRGETELNIYLEMDIDFLTYPISDDFDEYRNNIKWYWGTSNDKSDAATIDFQSYGGGCGRRANFHGRYIDWNPERESCPEQIYLWFDMENSAGSVSYGPYRLDVQIRENELDNHLVYYPIDEATCSVAIVDAYQEEGELVIPDRAPDGRRVTHIKALGFYLRDFSSVILPDSLIEIGYHAFGSMENITYISVPNHVKKIDDDVFKDCTALETVVLPESIEYIAGGYYPGSSYKPLFGGCTSLSAIYCVRDSYAWNWCAENGYEDLLVAWDGTTDPRPGHECLSGVVKVASGAPVENVYVNVFDQKNNLIGSIYTGKEGKWTVEGVTKGSSYKITYFHNRYSIQSTQVTVGENQEIAAVATLPGEIDYSASFTMKKGDEDIGGDASTMVGEEVQFKVSAPNAAKVQLIVDDIEYEEYVVVSGYATFTRSFNMAGTRTVRFHIMNEGEFNYTSFTPSQTIMVDKNDTLKNLKVESVETYSLTSGKPLEIQWNKIDHAVSYRVYLYYDGVRVYPSNKNSIETETSNESIAIDVDHLFAGDKWTAEVVAAGERGWSSITATSNMFAIVPTLDVAKILSPTNGYEAEIGEYLRINVAKADSTTQISFDISDADGNSFPENNITIYDTTCTLHILTVGTYTIRVLADGVEQDKILITVKEPKVLGFYEHEIDPYYSYTYVPAGTELDFHVKYNFIPETVVLCRNGVELEESKIVNTERDWEFSFSEKLGTNSDDENFADKKFVYSIKANYGKNSLSTEEFITYVMNTLDESSERFVIEDTFLYRYPEDPDPVSVGKNENVYLLKQSYQEFWLVSYHNHKKPYFIDHKKLKENQGTAGDVLNIIYSNQSPRPNGFEDLRKEIVNVDDLISFQIETIESVNTVKVEIERINPEDYQSVKMLYKPYDKDEITVENASFCWDYSFSEEGVYQVSFIPAGDLYGMNSVTFEFVCVRYVDKTKTMYIGTGATEKLYLYPHTTNEYLRLSSDIGFSEIGNAGGNRTLIAIRVRAKDKTTLSAFDKLIPYNPEPNIKEVNTTLPKQFEYTYYGFVKSNLLSEEKNKPEKYGYLFIAKSLDNIVEYNINDDTKRNFNDIMSYMGVPSETPTVNESLLMQWIDYIAADTDANDTVIIAIMAHGTSAERNNKTTGFILLDNHDDEDIDWEKEEIKAKWNNDFYAFVDHYCMSYDEFCRAIKKIPGTVNIWMCPCESGTMKSSWDILPKQRFAVITGGTDKEFTAGTFTWNRYIYNVGHALIYCLHTRLGKDMTLGDLRTDMTEIVPCYPWQQTSHPQYYGNDLIKVLHKKDISETIQIYYDSYDFMHYIQ